MKILNLFKAQKISNPEPGIAAPKKKTSTNFVDPEGGWVPMGYDNNGNYVVLSRKTGYLVILRAQDMNFKTLLVRLGREVRNFSTVYDNDLQCEVTDPKVAAEAIAEACDRLGPFAFEKVRGPGMYLDGDDLIVNFGHQVAKVSGEVLALERQKNGTAYQSGPSLGFSMETPCASPEETQHLLRVFGSFNLKSQRDLMTVVGWYAATVYGAVAKNLPILAISAERGSGKSTLIGFLSSQLGPRVVRRDGVPTVAQAIYELEHQPAPLILDEFEGRASKKAALDELAEIFRSGFDADGPKRITRVRGGKTVYFNAPSGVLVAGIGVPVFNDATETRTVHVCMGPLPEASRTGYEVLLDATKQQVAEEFGARIRRLLVARWNVMRDAMEAVRAMLIGIGHDARMTDTYTSMLAGYIALTHDSLPSAEQLKGLISQMGLNVVVLAKVVERDSDVCLQTILNRKVAIFWMVNGEKEKVHLTIRDLLTHVVHGDAGSRELLSRQLEEFGVRPMWDRSSGSWKVAICASVHHEGMRRLMMRTDWALGGWKDVLMRLPGAEASVQKVARVGQRVVLLDMPREVLEPENPDYDFPVPEAA